MMRSLSSAVAGLRTHQTKMDVIGNNIANVNTYGFKTSRTTFADVYYQNLAVGSSAGSSRGGTNPTQIGYGASVATIDVLNTQSGSGSTDRSMDVYITGDGYLVTQDANGNFLYTRMGAMYFDAEGNLVDSLGNYMMGFPTDANGEPIIAMDGTANSDELKPIQIDTMLLDQLTGISISADGIISGILPGNKKVTVSSSSPSWLNAAGATVPEDSLYTGGVRLKVRAEFTEAAIQEALKGFGITTASVSDIAFSDELCMSKDSLKLSIDKEGSLFLSGSYINENGKKVDFVSTATKNDGSDGYTFKHNGKELVSMTIASGTSGSALAPTAGLFTVVEPVNPYTTPGTAADASNTALLAALRAAGIDLTGVNFTNTTTIDRYANDGLCADPTDVVALLAALKDAGIDLTGATFKDNNAPVYGTVGISSFTTSVALLAALQAAGVDVSDVSSADFTCTTPLPPPGVYGTSSAIDPTTAGALQTALEDAGITGITSADLRDTTSPLPVSMVYSALEITAAENGDITITGNYNKDGGGDTYFSAMANKPASGDIWSFSNPAFSFDLEIPGATFNPVTPVPVVYGSLQITADKDGNITIEGAYGNNGATGNFTAEATKPANAGDPWIFNDPDTGISFELDIDGAVFPAPAAYTGFKIDADENGDIMVSGLKDGVQFGPLTGTNAGSVWNFSNGSDIDFDLDLTLAATPFPPSKIDYSGLTITANANGRITVSGEYSKNGGTPVSFSASANKPASGSVWSFTETGTGISFTMDIANATFPPVVLEETLSRLTQDIDEGEVSYKYNATVKDKGGNTHNFPERDANGNIVWSTITGDFTFGDIYIPVNASSPDIAAFNGTIATVSTTDGEILNIGCLVLAKFRNASGLKEVGTTSFAVSANSGEAMYVKPGLEGTGDLKAGYLEMSNVDISKEFTDMITTQRGFQANTRIVTVSDEMLQELVNLKR